MITFKIFVFLAPLGFHKKPNFYWKEREKFWETEKQVSNIWAHVNPLRWCLCSQRQVRQVRQVRRAAFHTGHKIGNSTFLRDDKTDQLLLDVNNNTNQTWANTSQVHFHFLWSIIKRSTDKIWNSRTPDYLSDIKRPSEINWNLKKKKTYKLNKNVTKLKTENLLK